MTMQHVLFPDADICGEESLFFRRSGKTLAMPGILRFKELEQVEFDTYFNAVSIGKWLKYTSLQTLTLRLQLKGSFIVWIRQRERYTHGTIVKTITQYSVTCGEREEMAFPVPYLEGNGLIYFSLQAVGDNAELYGGEWHGEFEKTQAVKLGVIFCTYKREQYVLRNLNRLREYDVFVVDNAGTLPEDCCKHLYRNPNLGGSGGFARGMYEVAKLPEYTHVLLMDDDVAVHPESVYRTQTLYTALKPEYRGYLVGGAMFRLDHPVYQHEAGCRLLTGTMGISVSKSGRLMSDPEQCLLNEFEETCDHNAWFFCAFPVELCRGDQLPLPLFMQWDDVEFSLRQNKRFIHMNGLCVWHEDFEAKLYFGGRVYYAHRNSLIVFASHGIGIDAKRFLKGVKNYVLRELLCQRYKIAESILDGIADFLKGVDWLKGLDAAAKHNEFSANGYKLEDPETLGVAISWDDLENAILLDDKSRLRRFFRLLSFNGLFRRPDKVAVTHMQRARPVHFYRAASGVYYDMQSRKAFVTQRSKGETFRLLRKYRAVRKQFLKAYKKVAAEYQARRGELTGVAFWEGQFKG